MQLEQRLNIELLELNCNVHPLASEARKTLKKVDEKYKIKSTLFGNDCCAANVTYRLSKMHYNNGKIHEKASDPIETYHKICWKQDACVVSSSWGLLLLKADITGLP